MALPPAKDVAPPGVRRDPSAEPLRRTVAPREADNLPALEGTLAQLVAEDIPRAELAEKAIRAVVDALHVPGGALIEYVHPGRLALLSSVGADPKFMALMLERSGKWIPLRCVNERQVKIIEAAHQNPFVPPQLVAALGPKYLAIATIPISRDGSPVGVVILFSPNRNTFTEAMTATLSQALSVCAPFLAQGGPGAPVAQTTAVRFAAPTGLRPSEAPASDWRQGAPPAPEPDDSPALRAPAAREYGSGRPGPPASPRESSGSAGAERPPAMGFRQSPSPMPHAEPGVRSHPAAPTMAMLRTTPALDPALRAQAEPRTAQLEKELAALRSEVQRLPALQRQLQVMGEELREARSALEAARTQTSTLQASLAEAQRRAQTAAASARTISIERDELRKRLEELDASSRGQAAQVEALENRLRELAGSAGAAERLRESEARRVALEGELALLREAACERERLEAELALLREQYATVENDRAVVAAALEQRTQDYAVVKFEALHLATQLADVQARSDAQVAESPETVRGRETLLALQNENEGLRRDLEEARRVLAAREREEESLALRWTAQLAELESARQQLEQQLAREREAMHLEAERLRGRIAALEEQARGGSVPAPADHAARDAEAAMQRELLVTFSLEASESLEICEQLVLQLEKQPGDREAVDALFRQFHTLKGAAAAVGLEDVARQFHEGESLLEEIGAGAVAVDSRVIDFLFRLTDSVAGLIRQGLGEEAVDNPTQQIMEDVAGEVTRLRSTTVEAVPSEGEDEAQASAARGAAAEADVIRVQTASLEVLVEQLGRLDMTRSHLHHEIQRLANLRGRLQSWRHQLNEASVGQGAEEAGSNESFAAMFRFADEAGLIVDLLAHVIEKLREQDGELSAVGFGLQQQVNELRMVPVDAVFRRLSRSVRDAARVTGKLVELEVQGGDVLLERNVTESLYAPLLHLVRNCVAHGIELPEVREQRGKPRAGTITVSAAVVESDGGAPRLVQIAVADDGGGINFEAILNKARARGFVAAEETPDRDQLLSLILQPGFSTETSINELAGRGVGMDVVAQQVAELNGTLEIESTDGEGTVVRLLLPAP